MGWLTTPTPWWPSSTPLEMGWTLAFLAALLLAVRLLRRRGWTWLLIRRHGRRVPGPERAVATEWLWLALGLLGMAACWAGVGAVAVFSRPGENAAATGTLLVLGGLLFVALLGWLNARIGVLDRATDKERAQAARDDAPGGG